MHRLGPKSEPEQENSMRIVRKKWDRGSLQGGSRFYSHDDRFAGCTFPSTEGFTARNRNGEEKVFPSEYEARRWVEAEAEK